jgi:hypothetical protein
MHKQDDILIAAVAAVATVRATNKGQALMLL